METSQKRPSAQLKYNTGFGNHFATEALPGALPKRGNNPRECKYGLFAEQISGTAFTVPRCKNRRTWVYRGRPSANQGRFINDQSRAPLVQETSRVTPERLRWGPLPINGFHTFVEGLVSVAGLAIYLYTATLSMVNTCFSSSDGDMLIVPELGTLFIQTELGNLCVPPGHVTVIPRGIRFAIWLYDNVSKAVADNGSARGYVLEVFSGSFELPDLGLIGANGLANPRDFRYPVAAYVANAPASVSLTKFQGHMFKSDLPGSPFDVVAWHGNYAPFAYDLSLFCPVNSVLFDHMDPSIFTVLTVPSSSQGTAVADFVIFPPRWATQEDTFRLPYYHRNCMSEYMGVILGSYEAKEGGKFRPGASTLHSLMAPHGPDFKSWEAFMAKEDHNDPTRMSSNDLAFMFETNHMLKLSAFAMDSLPRDEEYISCWRKLGSTVS